MSHPYFPLFVLFGFILVAMTAIWLRLRAESIDGEQARQQARVAREQIVLLLRYANDVASVCVGPGVNLPNVEDYVLTMDESPDMPHQPQSDGVHGSSSDLQDPLLGDSQPA